MKEKTAKRIKKKTERNYDKIADDFSRTRFKVWPALFRFKDLVDPKNKVLDIGCGNGRLRALFKDKQVEYVGVDVSEQLLFLARRSKKFEIKNQKFQKADGADLPFLENEFDAVFIVAVLHHIPSRSQRLLFFKEASRVLKEDGVLVVVAWNLWRIRFLKNHLASLKDKLLGGDLGWKDLHYPWKNEKGEIITQRFFHCFTRRELVRLTKEAGLKVIESGFLPHKRNIYVVCKAPIA